MLAEKKGFFSPPVSRIWLSLVLVAAVVSVYARVAGHQFICYDDGTYILENRMVLKGFSREGFFWALTATRDANWFPLTWFSHMLDVQLFGINPAGHHLVNVAIHAANTLLLFFLLAKITGSSWRSALVAALFALHPLRVESVAWAAERKDLLSGLFWLLTMLGYTRYAERPSSLRYLAVLLLFALGLMTKSMLVTLPFVLLMLDVWPLHRVRSGLQGIDKECCTAVSPWRCVAEKVPLLVVAAASSVLTLMVQRQGGALNDFERFPFSENLQHALISYLVYIRKFFWPTELAVFYPFERNEPVWWALSAAVLLIVVTWIVVRRLKKSPAAAFGWFWYLGTMVPVIGIVPVGAHAYADRYTYLPLIGIAILVVWVGAEAAPRLHISPPLLAVAAIPLLAALSLLTIHQLRFWHDSESLFSQTIRVTKNNWVAHNNLAAALVKEGKGAEAEEHLLESLRIRPDNVKALVNLGIVYAGQRRLYESVKSYQRALAIDPKEPTALYGIGSAMIEIGDFAAADREYMTLRPLNLYRAITNDTIIASATVTTVVEIAEIDELPNSCQKTGLASTWR